MISKTLTKVFGSRNTRILKELSRIVAGINALEPQMQALSDTELAAKTAYFKDRIAGGETAEDILPEAFAVVREVSQRTLKMRHFDVQLMGGIVLHRGKIAEMRTGEGKTLVATLPVYVNALVGHRVHIVTVNDYLARRDAEWMGAIYGFLGISVGVVVPNQPREEKKQAYQCDVVYGTNNEFGFDYLRDNMAFTKEQRSQGPLTYAIVDEVDSILIDEARTPLIISGAAEDSTKLYRDVNRLIPRLKRQEVEDGPGDFSVDEKMRQVSLTDEGHDKAEQLLVNAGLLDPNSSLYDYSNIALLHHIHAGLRAHSLFNRDVDYIVKNDQIIIIDEFTGRMMAGRRWGDGLHQAVEAKEGVSIQRENQTLASITFQNYFRLYDRLAGMTGTADTEAEEFQQIYGLEVVVIPTHLPMIRDDLPDLVYRTAREKFTAIVEGILGCRSRKQPVLVGTASIETSEYLSRLLQKQRIPHQVLNAKHHEREAQIVAQAGRPGAVTIATNMAGRGTDIVLGGNLEMELADVEESSAKYQSLSDEWLERHNAVVAAGGLHVLSTERHESRRVDNQLRGRSGRQGDPGSSRFYLSLEDDLMRIFASEKVSSLMGKLGMEDGEAIEHSWVTKSIENAQRKVEGRNFDIRKQLLEFDDVANEQRKVVYEQRSELMDADDISAMIQNIRSATIRNVVESSVPPDTLEDQWDVEQLSRDFEHIFNLRLPVQKWLNEDKLNPEELLERMEQAVLGDYAERSAGKEDLFRQVEKSIMLMVLDSQWKDHLLNMDHLRQGIHLRGYAQKNPRQEYKRESFEMFSAMLERVRMEIIRALSWVKVELNEAREQLQPAKPQVEDRSVVYSHPQVEAIGGGTPQVARPTAGAAPQSRRSTVETFKRSGRKVGRNEPCPCGSGRKYKRCCGIAA